MLSKKCWIAYVGPFSFPWGQAGSRRVCGISRSFADAGYDIVVCSGDSKPLTVTNLNEGEVLGSITYLGLREAPPEGISLSNKLLQLFILWGKKTVAWLEAQQTKPSHIVVYGGSAPYMFRLIPWCKRNNIPLIIDVVEWYDPSHMSGGFFGPFHISAKIAFYYYYPKCKNIIAISSYLENYFREKKCTVIRIPPILDVINHQLSFCNENKKESQLTLVYAGTPGKKDLLANVIHGISKIDPNGERVSLRVIGPSEVQVKKLIKSPNIPSFVKVFGKTPQSEVAEIVQQSDFSVLLREPLRFAEAGFPTKFAESMANGTPVIANLTSDLGKYLHDNIEGIVCQDHSISAFANALQKALLLTPKELIEMRTSARKQAKNSFDFRNYSDKLSIFLDRVS